MRSEDWEQLPWNVQLYALTWGAGSHTHTNKWEVCSTCAPQQRVPVPVYSSDISTIIVDGRRLPDLVYRSDIMTTPCRKVRSRICRNTSITSFCSST